MIKIYSTTFVVIDCKKRKPVLVTQSAKKAKIEMKMHASLRTDIWIDNFYIKTIYSNQLNEFASFVLQEKQYIARKQQNAEKRNKRNLKGK